jgi:hypothetical protein
MKIAASILAIAIFAAPLHALASNHGGGGGGESHSSGGSGGSHAAPAARAATPSHAAPAPRSAPIGGEPRSLPPGGQPPRPSRPGPVQPLPIYGARTPVAPARPVPNPNNTQPWSWNGGIAWIGYGGYWGNGFWGPLAYGLGAASYVVASGSPGAQLLQAYELTQTPCGPPNLVEIYGPDGSEICAFPNALVAPGMYYVDYGTLTLYSGPPQSDGDDAN